MQRNLRKAVLAALGTAALVGISPQASAWTAGPIGSGNYTLGSPQSITDTAPFKAWSDYNSDGAFHNMIWAHTSDWLKIQIGTDQEIASGAKLDVQFKIQGTDTGPGNASKWTGFTIWTTGTNPVVDAGTGTAHAYVQALGPKDGPSNANIPSAGGFPNGVIDYPNYGLNDGGTGSCGVNGGSCSNVLPGRAGWVGYGNTGLGFQWSYEDSNGTRQIGGQVVGNGGEFNASAVGAGSGVDNSVREQVALNLCGLKAGYYLINVGGVCPDRSPTCLKDAKAGQPTSGKYAGTGGEARGYTFSVGPAECQSAPPPGNPKLSVNTVGDGTGKVVSSPAGIDCVTDSTSGCSADFATAAVVTLTATPDTGSKLEKWSGCTSVTGSECTVVMDKDGKSVTAQFAKGAAPPPSGKFALTVTKSGNGKISSDPAGIDCNADCNEEYAAGTLVTLTATPDQGHQFSGWSGGGCSGTGTCKVTVNAKTDVTATFAVIAADGQFVLTVTNGGNGKVTSTPSGIDCGATCSAAFAAGTSVTLTAAPDDDFQFGGWGGACSGTDPCTVTLSEAKNVTATFTAAGGIGPYELTVKTSGSGSVTSSPAGIDCGSSCRASFDSGASVTLTARPNTGWRFAGWSGACGASETCTLNLSAAKTITARFARPPLRDYDGDGRADLFWRSPKTGRNNLWLMEGRTLKASITLPEKDKGWSIAAVADFDGDRDADVLWHRRATGQNHLWLMQAGTVKSIVALPDQSSGFSTVRSADFDRDGKPDLLWHNPATGEVSLSLMDGSVLKGTIALPAAPAGHALAEVADFNGDDSPDVWWHDPATGQSSLWLMAATAVQSTATPPAQSAGWKLAGAGLFDDDTKSDLLWRKPSTGENQIWLMDGGNRSASVDPPKMARVWYPAAVDDYDGKGRADILWRNRKNGKNRLWAVTGAGALRQTPVTAFSKGWATPGH